MFTKRSTETSPRTANTKAVCTVTNEEGGAEYAGRTFSARIIFPGDAYGLGDCLLADKTMVEVYDAKYAGKKRMDAIGQFVSRYFLSDFMGITSGLSLDGGIAYWTLDAAAVAEMQLRIYELLETVTPGIPYERKPAE